MNLTNFWGLDMTISSSNINSDSNYKGISDDIFFPTIQIHNKFYVILFLFHIVGPDNLKRILTDFLSLLNIKLSKIKYLTMRRDIFDLVLKFLPENETTFIHKAILTKAFNTIRINFYLFLRSLFNYLDISYSVDFMKIFEDFQNSCIINNMFTDQVTNILTIVNTINESSSMNNFLVIIIIIITLYFSILEIKDEVLIEEWNNIRMQLMMKAGHQFFKSML